MAQFIAFWGRKRVKKCDFWCDFELKWALFEVKNALFG